MLRIPLCVENRLTVNCEVLRERERQRPNVGGGIERHYNRGGAETIIFYLISQAFPASPSDKSEA
jgi:hypothetical protein